MSKIFYIKPDHEGYYLYLLTRIDSDVNKTHREHVGYFLDLDSVISIKRMYESNII